MYSFRKHGEHDELDSFWWEEVQEAMLHGAGYHADKQDKTEEGQKQRTASQHGSCRSSNRRCGLRVDFDEEYSCGRVTFGPDSRDIGSASAAFRPFSDAAEAPRSSWLLAPGEKGNGALQTDRQPDGKANRSASSMCIDLTGNDHDEVDAPPQRRAKRKMSDVVFVNEERTSLKRSQRIANGQVEQIAADRALALKIEREEREANETGKVAPPPSKNVASALPNKLVEFPPNERVSTKWTSFLHHPDEFPPCFQHTDEFPPPRTSVKQIAASKIAQDGWMEDGLLQPKDNPAIANQHVTCSRDPANPDAESGAETPCSPILIPSRLDLRVASKKAKASAEEKAAKEAFTSHMTKMLWSAPDSQSQCLAALPTKSSTFTGAAPGILVHAPQITKCQMQLSEEQEACLAETKQEAERLRKEMHDLQVVCSGLKKNFEDEVKRAEFNTKARQGAAAAAARLAWCQSKSEPRATAQLPVGFAKGDRVRTKVSYGSYSCYVEKPNIYVGVAVGDEGTVHGPGRYGHYSHDRRIEVDFGSKGIRECFVSNVEHLGCNRNPKPIILPMPAAALPRSRLAAASSACRFSVPGGLPKKVPKQLHTTWPAPIPIPHLKSYSLASDVATDNLSVATSVPGGPPTLAPTQLNTTLPPPPIPIPHLKSSEELDPSTDYKKTGCHCLFAVKSFWQSKLQRNSPSEVFEVPKSAKGTVVC